MARSTRASAAVERLKQRSGNAGYAMVCLPGERFCLALNDPSGRPVRLCEAMDQDRFIAYVNALVPAKPRKAGKLDLAFEKQLVRKT